MSITIHINIKLKGIKQDCRLLNCLSSSYVADRFRSETFLVDKNQLLPNHFITVNCLYRSDGEKVSLSALSLL